MSNAKRRKIDYESARPYIILIAGGLLIRLIAAGISRGHSTDIQCFYAWADRMYNIGFRNFYSPDYFSDYPPGYMYILYITGFLRNALNLEYGGFMHNLLVKLPAMLADVGAGVLVYRMAAKHRADLSPPSVAGLSPLSVASLVVFNPLIIMISAVWGQVDSVYAVLLAASLWRLAQKKDTTAYLLYALAILTKPQTLMFGPIYLVCAILRFAKDGFNTRELGRFLLRLLLSVSLLILMILPFMTYPIMSNNPETGRTLAPVLQQLLNSMASYPYCTVNAYNLYGLLGLNFAPLTNTFLSTSYNTYGIIAISAAALIGTAMIVRKRGVYGIFYAAAAICALVFTFATRMHERYSYPIFIFLPVVYAFSRDRNIVRVFVALAAASFLNCADALRLSLSGWDYSVIDITSRVFSGLWMIAFVGFAVVTCTHYIGKRQFRDIKARPQIPFEIQDKNQDNSHKLGRNDYIIMGIITVVYAAVAFFRLGDTVAPENPWTPPYNGEAVLDIGENVNNAQLWFFNGVRHEQQFLISLSEDGENFAYINENDQAKLFSTGSVFRWHNQPIYWDIPFRYIKIVSQMNDLMLMEAAVKDEFGSDMRAVCVTNGAEALTDELNLVPERHTQHNGTYFDEVYHPRTAYEFIHGLTAYETSHPPLGKVIIAAGVKVFGMNPFGWRFAGTLTGVLMIPLLYLFAKQLFKSTFAAFLTSFVFAFDFMHFVQTRLATIDSYIVIFIILMYYFMYKYTTMSFYNEPLRKTLLPLFLSGLFMGLGIAAKWTGIYAGLGLAIIFTITMWRRYKEYRYAKINKSKRYYDFGRKLAATLLCCIAFFIIIPALIYVASYIPMYRNAGSLGNFLKSVWGNQELMFGYHGYLVAEHPYSSPWWSWAVMLRPIWYYSGRTLEELREGISGFGNPAVWWGGLAAFGYTLYSYIKTRDKTALFLIIGYLLQYLPWMYVTRIVFIYHYFTCVPFLALMLGYAFGKLSGKEIRVSGAVFKLHHLGYVFMVITALLFIVFYPALTGTAVSSNYISWLKWFDKWVIA